LPHGVKNLIFCLDISRKPEDEPSKTHQQEIGEKKQAFLGNSRLGDVTGWV
jgi:hypothetical protein